MTGKMKGRARRHEDETSENKVVEVTKWKKGYDVRKRISKYRGTLLCRLKGTQNRHSERKRAYIKSKREKELEFAFKSNSYPSRYTIRQKTDKKMVRTKVMQVRREHKEYLQH